MYNNKLMWFMLASPLANKPCAPKVASQLLERAAVCSASCFSCFYSNKRLRWTFFPEKKHASLGDCSERSCTRGVIRWHHGISKMALLNSILGNANSVVRTGRSSFRNDEEKSRLQREPSLPLLNRQTCFTSFLLLS